MYTTTMDSLALPLDLHELLSEPQHGRLLKGDKSAFLQSQTNYIYIPKDDFAGIETFDYLSKMGSRATVTIHVTETTNGSKVFIPFIHEHAITKVESEVQTYL